MFIIVKTCMFAYGSLPRDFVAAPPKGMAVYEHIPPTPYSGLLLSNKMQAFCWVWGLRTSKFYDDNNK